MDARTVPEWPGFDPETQVYIAETGGGEGWTVGQYQDEGESLDDVLRHDYERALDDDDDWLDVFDWEDWIDALTVYEYDEYGDPQEVAHFDPRKFEWCAA